MFYLAGLAIFLFTSVSTVLFLGGDISTFFYGYTYLIMLILLAGVLTATQSFKVFYAGMKAVILPHKPMSEDMRGKAASLFRFLSKTTALIAGIMVLISLINMLFGLDFEDPQAISKIGVNAAYALVFLFQGLTLIAAVFEPVVFILKKRQGHK